MVDVSGHHALVLASGSRARYEILKSAGLSFTVDPANIDEAAIRDSLIAKHDVVNPRHIALDLASAKALSVGKKHADEIVIGSDQILALGDEIFSKPEDLEAARETLTILRGRTHALHSAVVVASGGNITWRHVDTAYLKMRNFSDEFLIDYLRRAGSDVCQSVGAYQIEGTGVQLFETIDEGDYFTILGLPLLPLLAELRKMGVLSR